MASGFLMGFSEIWSLYDKKTISENEVERFLTCDTSAKTVPWLLIDFSNVNGFLSNAHYGHRSLFETHLEQYWRAVFLSGFKVKIVKDGKHNALRGLTKLQRMLNQANEIDINSVTGAMKFYLDSSSIVESVLEDSLAYWQRKVDSGEVETVPIIEIVSADEEADSVIRNFCRETIRKNPKEAIIILSNDASLILGLEGNIYLVSPTRLVLRNHESKDSLFLYGPALSVKAIGEALSRLCCQTLEELNNPSHGPFIQFLRSQPVSPTVLLMVSCLLGGEHRQVDCEDYETKPFGADMPFAIVVFLSNFLFPFNHPFRSKENRKLGNLVCATLAVMTFFNELIKNKGYPQVCSTSSLRNDQCFSAFGLFLKEMKDCSTNIINSTSRNGSFSQPNLFQTLFPCNTESFFKVCVSTSSIHIDKMLQVLKNRLSESADLPSPAGTALYSARWGFWLTFDFPSAADDELPFVLDDAIQPLESLISQIQLLLKSDRDPIAALEAPVHSGPSGPSVVNNWIAKTEVLRVSATASQVVWKGLAVNTCPRDCTSFTERHLFNFSRLSRKLPVRGFLVQSDSARTNGRNRGLAWTSVRPLQHALSQSIRTHSPALKDHILIDNDRRAQYLRALASSLSDVDRTERLLGDMCHPTLSGFVASRIEQFWSQGFWGDWFRAAETEGQRSKATAKAARMSALRCAAVLQGLLLVFRDHPSLLPIEGALALVLEAFLLSPFFGRSVAAAVAVADTADRSGAGPGLGLQGLADRITVHQSRVLEALQLPTSFSESTYSLVEIVHKVNGLLNGLIDRDRLADWQSNRWLDLFGISAVLQSLLQQPATSPLNNRELLKVLRLDSEEIVSTTFIFVNGLSIPKTNSSDGLKLIQDSLAECKSQVLEALRPLCL